jgi:serine/threonine protein kinase
MSAAQLPVVSSPRLGRYSRRESAPAEDLTTAIRKSVESTVVGITVSGERAARSFLGKADRERILDSSSLAQLFRELTTKYPARLELLPGRSHLSKSNEREGHDHNAHYNDLIDLCVEATITRKALLALFLYQDREPLLIVFLEWVLHIVSEDLSETSTSGGIDVPLDDSMPFTEESLEHYGIAQRYHQEILRNQWIFMPVNIRKNQHRDLSTNDRLPFIGAKAKSKAGSSGTVSEVTIAKMHWEIQDGHRIIIGNPDDNHVVAVKTFKEIPIVRDMKTTTEEFEIERGILQDFRRCNTKHEMIMLDWGSITVRDDVNNALSHSLIFELATFSLQDFFESKRRSDTYTKKSLLLARLVDLVDALAILHDSLRTLHLDIKPDNILVFERGSSRSENQNEDPNKLVLKLSDFGLARKIGTGQRNGHNRIDSSYQPSRSSATSATRPAGTYQGPEIQQQDSSRAGRGSDVWSIGCVALMMLAFVTGGPEEVSKLTQRLPVDFLGRDGRQNLFYIRSDSHPWKTGDVEHFRYQYMKRFKPVIGQIDRTQPPLQAAINPQVIVWSNVLHDSYDGDTEQQFIQEWLEAIFCSALLVDRKQRVKAAGLHETLRKIKDSWHEYEENPEDFSSHQVKTTNSLSIYSSHQRVSSRGKLPQSLTMTSQISGEPEHQHQLALTVPTIASQPPTPPASPLPLPTSSDSTILGGDNIATIAPLGAPLLPVITGAALPASSLDLSSLVPKVEPLQPEIASPVPAQASNAQPDTPRSRAPQTPSTSSLCSTIRADDENAVRRELGDGNERLREPCPGTGTYPIHCALKYRAYNALAVLLEKADPDIMDLECGGRTALEMACEEGGRSEAFRCFRRYHTCLKFPEDVYKEYKNELGTDARKAFVELYDMINSGKKKQKRSWTFGGRK